MNIRAFVGATQTHEVTSESVQLYVPEENFIALKTGATADEVVKTIGAPRKKQQGAQKTWHYGVWRGETPSFWNFLFIIFTFFSNWNYFLADNSCLLYFETKICICRKKY